MDSFFCQYQMEFVNETDSFFRHQEYCTVIFAASIGTGAF
jgi:hypothetical protein